MVQTNKLLSFVFIIAHCIPMMVCNAKNSSSSDGKSQEDSIIVKTPPAPYLGDFKGIEYSELFSDVRYIRLESNFYSGLTQVSKLEITNNNDILVFDSSNKNIVLFDSLGNYRNNIGIQGSGLGEYEVPIDVTYDKYYNQVIVFDNPGYLYYYNMDGTFVSKQKIPWYLGSISVLGKDTLAIDNNFTDPINSEGVGYNFHIFLRNGQSIARFNPYDKTKLYSCHTAYQTFSCDGSRWFAHELYSPRIYTVDPEGMRVSYVYELNGREELPDEQKKILSQKFDLDKINQEYRFWNFFKSDDYIFTTFVGGFDFINIYDITQKSSKNFNAIANDFGGPGSLIFKLVHKNQVYIAFNSSEFNSDYYDVVNEDQRRELEKLSHNGNPVLQVCVLK